MKVCYIPFDSDHRSIASLCRALKAEYIPHLVLEERHRHTVVDRHADELLSNMRDASMCALYPRTHKIFVGDWDKIAHIVGKNEYLVWDRDEEPPLGIACVTMAGSIVDNLECIGDLLFECEHDHETHIYKDWPGYMEPEFAIFDMIIARDQYEENVIAKYCSNNCISRE